MNDGGPQDYDRRATTGALGAFGKLLMECAFDPAMRASWRVLTGTAAADADGALHERLRDLTEDERDAVLALARGAAVEALHGILYLVSDGTSDLRLLFEGIDLADASDGLHGDLFIWMRDMSEFPHDWEQDGPLLE